jgi:hypothetical protein
MGRTVNIRRGFARLARVTAVTYGIVSVVIVVAVLKGRWEEHEADLHPHKFTVSAPNGRVYVVPAQYDWEAISAAKDYDAAHPAVAPAEQPSSNVSEWTDDQLMASLNGQYTAQTSPERTAKAANPARNFFDQFDPQTKKAPAQKPIRVPVAKYDHPRSVAAVGKEGALAAMWCALVYTVLWALFRGLRWIVLGFMEDRRAGA